MHDEDFYAAWHREAGNSEYRITITMAGYGSDPDAGERFLEGFLEACPEMGPVVSQDAEEDTISVTLAVSAGDRDRAVDLAGIAWVRGGSASGLEPTRVVRVEVEDVNARVGELVGV